LDDQQTVTVAAFEESWCVRGKPGHAGDYHRITEFAPEPFLFPRESVSDISLYLPCRTQRNKFSSLLFIAGINSFGGWLYK
jgi:hypothetical protein